MSTTDIESSSTAESTVTDSLQSPSSPSTTTSTSTTPTPTPPTTNMTYPREPKVTDGQQLETGVIVGIAVGSVAFLAVIAAIAILILRRCKSKSPKKTTSMMPRPFPPVHSSSTADLVRNVSLEPTSADNLPIAPPPPLDYGNYGDDLYVNQDAENGGRNSMYEVSDNYGDDNYLEPKTWGSDEYIAMGATSPNVTNVNHVLSDSPGEQPVPSSAIVAEIEDSESRPRPPTCVGSQNKGYVNVPHSNTHAGDTSSDDCLEDYENVPKVNTISEIGRRIYDDDGQSPRAHTIGETSVSESLTVTKDKHAAKKSPKGKHKKSPKPCKPKSDSNTDGADYVNIKQYSKTHATKKH